jgi:hypothetical protein
MHTRRAGHVVAPPLNCGVIRHVRHTDTHDSRVCIGLVIPLATPDIENEAEAISSRP